MRSAQQRQTLFHFQRHECKYLLSESQALQIRRYAAPFVKSDPYGKQYPISSLYLDSPTLKLRRETESGDKDRFKLRIRCYNNEVETPIFLEIKKRHTQVISKVRCRIHRDSLADVLAGRSVDSSQMVEREIASLDEFRHKMLAIRAQPIVQVGYVREACISIEDPNVRVTFDRKLRSRATDGPELSLTTEEWDAVETRRVILELKFNGRCPIWMDRLIRRFQLKRISYSKYSRAIDASARNIRGILTRP